MSTKKTPPNLALPTDRASLARSFANPETNDKSDEAGKPKKKDELSSRYNASILYMELFDIEDFNSIEYTRFNCYIPKDLHKWLSVYSKSNSDGHTMTDIAIKLLGQFAKEHGFKPKKK
ncbi:hypothetical protein I6M70_17065 [Acinetobacter pittii]|uniref:hypothetical protein n=1 Tax=Acinetobacter pittii TaxID=48296 RepID=UPI0019003F09|nr:hypothetical protein [Acinetobacter pittii]MBJ8481071.1 hypothetical protein [Acinetobacter pittii]